MSEEKTTQECRVVLPIVGIFLGFFAESDLHEGV